MSLVLVIDAISNYVNQIVSNFQMPDLQGGGVLLGRKYINDTTGPNSIIVAPGNGQFGAPRLSPTATGNPDPARLRARPLWNAATDLEIHIWGRDFTETETLSRIFLVAAYQLTGQDVKPGGFKWESQDPSSPQLDKAGEYLIFQATLNAPIADLAVNLAGPVVHPKLVPTAPIPAINPNSPV